MRNHLRRYFSGASYKDSARNAPVDASNQNYIKSGTFRVFFNYLFFIIYYYSAFNVASRKTASLNMLLLYSYLSPSQML